MSPRHILVAIALVAASAVGPIAVAQSVSFESLDKNHDGKISLNEASADDDLFVKFKDLDKNKDGDLTKEEFAAYRKG